MLKNKRVVLVALAVVLLVLLFFIKTKSQWTNEEVAGAGLVSGDEILGDVLSKDTDKDGILDWEEGLWGTDPTKKDTNDDGVSDKEEIGRMKAERAENSSTEDGVSVASEENLSQTDKFARELFTTVAALNQSGEIDDNTVQQITDSLATQIQNPVQRKIFMLAEIKIKNDNSLTAVKNYNNSMGAILKGYPIINPTDVLKEATTNNGDIDSSILSKLDPFIEQTQKVISGMVKTEVPQDFSSLHLDAINALEKVMENLSDIQLIDSDAVIALSAVSQLENNNTALESATYNLQKAIWDKLNS